MHTHTGPNRFHPPRADRGLAEGLRDLATILARAFLRLRETARPVAVSDVTNPAGRLDVSALQRPHVTDNEAA